MLLGVRILPDTGVLVRRELETILNRKISIRSFTDDFIMFETDDFTVDACKIIVESKAIRGLYLVTNEFHFGDPTDLYKNALNVEWYEFFSHEHTFAVIPESKSIDRVTIGRNVGQGIVDSFISGTKKKPRVDLESPQIRILAKIVNSECLLGIDLIGRDLNDLDTICSRLTIIPCFSSTPFGEIFHSGCCESFFELVNGYQTRERIIDTTFTDLLCIDQEKVIDLLSAPQKQIFDAVFCFDTDQKEKTSHPIKHMPLDTFITKDIDIFGSNLTKRFPSKKAQVASINKLLELIGKNSSWVCGTILCRDESLDIIHGFDVEKLVKLNIRGISSTLIRVTRSE